MAFAQLFSRFFIGKMLVPNKYPRRDYPGVYGVDLFFRVG